MYIDDKLSLNVVVVYYLSLFCLIFMHNLNQLLTLCIWHIFLPSCNNVFLVRINNVLIGAHGEGN